MKLFVEMATRVRILMFTLVYNDTHPFPLVSSEPYWVGLYNLGYLQGRVLDNNVIVSKWVNCWLKCRKGIIIMIII